MITPPYDPGRWRWQAAEMKNVEHDVMITVTWMNQNGYRASTSAKFTQSEAVRWVAEHPVRH